MDKHHKENCNDIGHVERVLRGSESVSRTLKLLNPTMAKVPEFNFDTFSQAENTKVDFSKFKAATREEVNDYQSASVLIEAIAAEAGRWKEQLSEGFRPAVLAVLNGGIQIQIQNLSQISFHGIKVEGLLDGAPCSLLAHQSTIQLLCYAEKVVSEKPRNPIGFIWDDIKIEV